MAAEMAETHPPYAGYGPSANYFRERMPYHWPKIQALTRLMGAKDWAGVLKRAGLRFPSRGMMIGFSNAQKRIVPPWQHREQEPLLLPGGESGEEELRCYDGLPVIERRKWGEVVRRLDDERVLVRVVTVYEVR
jgi:hypothetical protein